VGGFSCNNCKGPIIKYGLVKGRQRYKCKICNHTQMEFYQSNACNPFISNNIISLLKEGCGIRSIARLLHISAVTVISRIRKIANAIVKPVITVGRTYEVDELRTYIKNKKQECWIIYALDKQNGQVVDLKVGKRTKLNLQKVTDTLLLSDCKQVYTDRLNTYRQLIPKALHKITRYGTNKIERKNLSLRTHLKRLNRKSICFSKNIQMLEASIKIYFWYINADCYRGLALAV